MKIRPRDKKTNENPSTDKLSRAINYGNDKGCHETKLNPKKQELSIKGAFMIIFHRVPLESSRFPCCVLLALSWNTTNENPSTDKLSRAIK